MITPTDININRILKILNLAPLIYIFGRKMSENICLKNWQIFVKFGRFNFLLTGL